MSEKNTIKPETESKIEQILLKLSKTTNIKSRFNKLEQGLNSIHKRIEQVNQKIKKSI